MTGFWACELLAFVFYFLYGSFFEWWFHKYLFHSPKLLKITFRAHTLIHHQVYKYEHSSYEWQKGQDDQEREHIAMDWFAGPIFVGVHLPFLWAIERLTGIPSMWGGVAAIAAYYAVYEYFHYCMHVPNNRIFETWGIFRYVKEHHRIHHKYMLQNLNVFFPLADRCLGTYRSAASVPQKRQASTEPAPVTTAPESSPRSATVVRGTVKPLSRPETLSAAGKD